MSDQSSAPLQQTADDAVATDNLANPAQDPASAAAADSEAEPVVQTRLWQGGTGDWYDPNAWTTSNGGSKGYPLPGDFANVGSGTALLVGSEAKNSGTFSGNTINLGGKGSATLDLVDATIGGFFNVYSQGQAEILSTGTSTFSGAFYGGQLGTTPDLTLASENNGGEGGNLVLEQASMSGISQLTIAGVVTVEGRAALNATSAVNNGTVNLIGNSNAYSATEAFNHIGGNVSGTGAFDLRFDTTLQIDGTVGSGQRINFGGVDGTLALGSSASFGGSVGGFAVGDRIDLQDAPYSANAAATYDAASQTLTVSDTKTGKTLASLSNVGAQNSALTVTADSANGSAGGLTVSYAAALPPATYALQGGDMAMHSNVVRQTMDVPGTATPIDGTGIKIGIVSTSLDYNGSSGTPDPLAAAIAAGYVPADLADSAHDLRDSVNDNEGLAMAELVHQVAPGADIYFAAASGSAGVGGAVQLLDQAGCKVIADDISYPDDPHYQIDSSACTAIENAVQNDHVNYFVAAGNYGHAFLESGFNASQRTLLDGSTVNAQNFGNGTPYELITVPSTPAASDTNISSTLRLQWAAPVGAGAASALQIKVFDANGNAVTNQLTGAFVSQPDTGAFANTPGCDFELPASATTQVYKVAVYQAPGATAQPSQFNMRLERESGGESPGGTIDDPAAGTGSGNLTGDELLPNVNTVGQVDFASSAAFGQKPTTAVAASDFGPGTLLYQTNGTPYSTPVSSGKVDFAAPSGIDTSVANFAPFYGTSAATPNAAAVAALMLQANPGLTTSQVTQDLEQSAIPFGDADQTGAGLIQADVAVGLAEASSNIVCFAAGTRILTTRGAVPVEELRVDDVAIVAGGAHRVITWLGSRTLVPSEHAEPWNVHPVRVRMGAFGADLPERDLFLSPGHPVLVDADEDGEGGHLVPIMCLINGTAIERTPVAEVTYWHVELDQHDTLLAEGLPCESYIDLGSRPWFDGSDAPLHDLDFVSAGMSGRCRPVAIDGPIVEAERRRLDALFGASLVQSCSWPTRCGASLTL